MADSFAEFVSTRSGRLLRVAYLLTRDWALAEDLLQTSLAKTWTAWRRIEGDPEPYVRRILVNTYTTWWRRRWTNEHPTSELPERGGSDRHGEVDDRDQIVRALGRLPRQQRAVIVLRYYEDLSEAEIADTLGIAPGTVKTHAAKGLAALRLDASLAVLRVDGEEPVGAARLAAVTQRVHQRRRQKVTAVVAACAVVLAAIWGYAVSPHRRSTPHPATSPSPDTVNGFPRFSFGSQVVATAPVSAAQPQARLTWTPSNNDLSLFIHCSSATPDVIVYVSVSIGATELTELTCSGNEGAATNVVHSYRGQDFVAAGLLTAGGLDLRIDRAASTDGTLPDKEAAVPADFSAVVAVGERMPFDAYPFPPAPSVLPSLITNGFDRRTGAVRVDADAADPLRPVSVQIPWRDWEIFSTLDAPGWIELALNGVPISKCEKWEYLEGGCHDAIRTTDPEFAKLGLRAGESVTLTVTPHRVGHAWQVWLAPS